jgi:hypothetical protein
MIAERHTYSSLLTEKFKAAQAVTRLTKFMVTQGNANVNDDLQ